MAPNIFQNSVKLSTMLDSCFLFIDLVNTGLLKAYIL